MDEAGNTAIEFTGVDSVPAGFGRNRRITHEAEILGAGIIILAGSFIYPHLGSVFGYITPGCIFHRITGLPCLLCGMTRSLAATAQGSFSEAFRLHLLGPPLFFLTAIVTILLVAEYVFSKPILPRPGKREWRYIAWGTLGLLIAIWIIRLAVFGANV